MQALKDIADFDAGAQRQFQRRHQPDRGAEHLPDQRHRPDHRPWRTNLNAATAANGYVSNRLNDAQTQQTSMNTLYKGFVSNIQDTNMADAATQLSLNQTQLQAALQVTAGLNQLSLLNYLPVSAGG